MLNISGSPNNRHIFATDSKLPMRIVFQVALVLIITVLTSCNDQSNAGVDAAGTTDSTSYTAGEGPLMVIDEEYFDFGKIAADVPVTHIFRISNGGNAPLIISECSKKCGCTVPKCDKSPIAPGGNSEIEVTFDAKARGVFNKTVTVESNSADGGTRVLRIKGEVVEENTGATEQ